MFSSIKKFIVSYFTEYPKPVTSKPVVPRTSIFKHARFERFTQEQCALMGDMYEGKNAEGIRFSAQQIARAFNTNKITVANQLDALGIKRRTKQQQWAVRKASKSQFSIPTES